MSKGEQFKPGGCLLIVQRVKKLEFVVPLVLVTSNLLQDTRKEIILGERWERELSRVGKFPFPGYNKRFRRGGLSIIYTKILKKKTVTKLTSPT